MDIIEEANSAFAQDVERYISGVYSVRVPEPPAPTKDDLSFGKIAGVEATLYTVSALGGVILSSIRTGGLFFILEQSLLSKFNINSTFSFILSLGALISSLLTFELSLVGVGFTRGKNLKSAKVSRLGIVLSFLVILAAGLYSGIGIINLSSGTENYLNVVMAIITAACAAFATYFGGENIGYSFSTVSQKRQELRTAHQEAYDNWRAAAVRSYMSMQNRSKAGSKMNANEHENERGSEERSNTVQKAFIPEQRQKKSELCRKEIEGFVREYKRLPTINEISRGGDAYSAGLVSGVMNQFIVDNGEYLLGKTVIDDARLLQATELVQNAENSRQSKP